MGGGQGVQVCNSAGTAVGDCTGCANGTTSNGGSNGATSSATSGSGATSANSGTCNAPVCLQCLSNHGGEQAQCPVECAHCSFGGSSSGPSSSSSGNGVACVTAATVVEQPGNVISILEGCTVNGRSGTPPVPSTIPVTLTNADLQFTVGNGFKVAPDPRSPDFVQFFWKLHNAGAARCDLNWTSASAVDAGGTVLGQTTGYAISHWAEFGPSVFSDACLGAGHDAWLSTSMRVQDGQGMAAVDQLAGLRVTLDRPSENTVAPDLVRVVNYSVLANGDLAVELVNQGTTAATLFSMVSGLVFDANNAPMGTVVVGVPNNLVLQPGDRLTRSDAPSSFVGSAHRILFRVVLN